eukprot:CAMPEP_0204256168 /NCGR_PEP_ID=MMETSP0468-20130131/3615_1 /ASSEMBLY_ACC=CAM_ASM_000383 /TAXON_ID=2969 /ORGANISM="Oxyrrhis marina" /LENGTH=190 /DNA_ID=CAMNT_0051230097 /DNA_START=23 /DNA_END=595 /DNA_ORIENTATION=+
MARPRTGSSVRSAFSEPRSDRSLRSAYDGRATATLSVTNPHRSLDSQPFIPRVGHYAVTGIPGYTGAIPGKYSENVLGASFQRANELALISCDRRGQPEPIQRAANPAGVGRARAGGDIVGYAGFVPGKYADNVFGHVFARSNKISQAVKREQLRSKTQELDMMRTRSSETRDRTGVLGHSGLMPAFLGQ